MCVEVSTVRIWNLLILLDCSKSLGLVFLVADRRLQRVVVLREHWMVAGRLVIIGAIAWVRRLLRLEVVLHLLSLKCPDRVGVLLTDNMRVRVILLVLFVVVLLRELLAMVGSRWTVEVSSHVLVLVVDGRLLLRRRVCRLLVLILSAHSIVVFVRFSLVLRPGQHSLQIVATH